MENKEVSWQYCQCTEQNSHAEECYCFVNGATGRKMEMSRGAKKII